MDETTRRGQYSTFPTLYLAFELGNKTWKLGFSIGLGQRPRERCIGAGDRVALEEEIRLGKKRFALAQEARVVSSSAGSERAVVPPGSHVRPTVRWSRSPGRGSALGEHSIGCLIQEDQHG